MIGFWSVVKVGREPAGIEVHVVVPQADLRPHDLHSRCWCRPEQDEEEPEVWAHNSLDGREAYESGERLLT